MGDGTGYEHKRGLAMSKSADAFRTISEVSTELSVPKHVLRFWEQRFKQLKPLKRGGGRRFYRPEDVELIKGIQALLNRHAYTIRGVQRILKEHGVERVKDLAKGAAAATLIASSPEGGATEPASASGGKGAGAKRKTGRAATSNTSSESEVIDRDVVVAAIAELSACRAVLLGEAAKLQGQSLPLAARGRQ